MVSAQDSTITSSSFSDKEIAELFSDVGEIDASVLFERELARVQESLQIIPAVSYTHLTLPTKA